MTLREILNILKSYAITTHVTWDIIKYDADKAIYKINDYLGTCYPKMSDVLISPDHTYSFMIGNKRIPIFPDRYIISIVIPFIASEILSREEEFTTAYNKYIVEVEDGLFNMFQNEFNRVPLMFRQSSDDGVFFENQTASPKPKLDSFGFHVHYHSNLEEDTKYLKTMIIDPRMYTYKDIIKVGEMPQTLVLNEDLGYYCYKFKGWTRDPRIITAPDLLQAGDLIEHPLTDIHLYAVWDKQLTINITDNTVYIKDEYKPLITNLRIPAVINGNAVYHIPAGFNIGASKLNNVIFPKTLQTIETSAFQSYVGVITFPTTHINIEEGISILSGAFDANCVLSDVYLPETVKTIRNYAFACKATFYCEWTENNAPITWEVTWCHPDSTIYWEVTNG